MPHKKFRETGKLELNFHKNLARPDVSKSMNFRGVNLAYNRVTSQAEYEFKDVGAHHYLALHDLVMEDGELNVEEMPTICGKDIRNTLSYMPAGRPFSGWSRTTGRQNSFTILHFDPNLLSQETEQVVLTDDHLPLIYFEDPMVLLVMKKLEAIIAAGVNHSSVYVERLALLAALEIGNLQSGFQKQTAGRLSTSQVSQLRDYIESNLNNDICLDDLAQLVHLSRFHLARRFKASFGAPPHQYITARRVEFAKNLLRESTLSVSEVASTTGFASVGAFIKSFRQQLGTTPAVFRRT